MNKKRCCFKVQKKVENARLVSTFVYLVTQGLLILANTGTAEGPKNYILGHHIKRFLSSFLYLQRYWGEAHANSYPPQLARTQALGGQCIRGDKREAGAMSPPSFGQIS